MNIVETLSVAGIPEYRMARIIEALPAPDSKQHHPNPEYLLARLVQAGLSQRAAAKIMGITYRQMRQYCSGTRECPYSIQYALEMLSFLNIPTNVEKRESEADHD